MIADLIDQDDLYEHFKTLGLPLSSPESADQCCQVAAQWLGTVDEGTQEAVKVLVEQLLQQEAILLPEIKTALEAHLVPALGINQH